MVDTKKFKAAVVEAGHTQRSLAQAMNKSKNSINSMLNGKSSISIEDVKCFCEILSLTSDRMLEIFFANNVSI